MENREVLEQWYKQYLANDLSEEELEQFLVALHNRENEQVVSSLMDKTWQEMYQNMPSRGISIRKNPIIRYLAAASVVAIIGIGTFFLFFNQRQNKIYTGQKKVLIQNDVVPGGDRAILTLADGRQIVLDSASNGALAQQGGIKVIKIGGKLTYDSQGDAKEVLYNTITTPKGGQFQLELADGTKVWLNAASSFKYPTSFKGKERTVELSGEGYFEVAHNAAMPFHVKVNAMDVQVVGTHFNINSYSDEPAVKTTLLEGRVLVKNKGNEVYLNPGQQAVLLPGKDNLIIANDVNVNEVVAWKNGRFLFNDTDIETIMRQAARWYDVGVVYENKMTGVISGGLPRTENISQFLKILEATGKVKFEINGRQIIVKPNK